MQLRRRLLLLLFPLVLAALGPPALAQQANGSIPSTGGGTSCVLIDATNKSTVGIQVTGTWSGTLQPQISIQGQAPQNVQVTPYSSSTAQSTITANGNFVARVGGGSTFLLCGNTVGSGTANVWLNATQAVSLNGVGSGGAASLSTLNGGSAPAGQTYDFNANADVVNVVTQATTDNSTKAASTAQVRNATVAGTSPALPQQASLLAEYIMPPSEVSTTTLTDYSGNGNNGTFPGGAANPTRNSYGGLSCARASSQFVSLPAALNATKTWLIVMYFDPNASGVVDRSNIISPAAGAGPTIFLSPSLAGYPSPNALTGTGVWGLRGWTSATTLTLNDTYPAHGWQIITWAEQAGGDKIYHYNNTINGVGTNLGVLGSSNYQLCGSGAASGNFFQGQILYAAAWSIGLTNGDVQQAVAAVQQKVQANDGLILNGIPGGGTWQTPSSLVSNNTLMFYGDSETGFLINPNFPTLSGKVDNIYDAGFAGYFSGQLAALAPPMIDVMLPNTGSGAPFGGTPVNSAGFNATKTAIIINAGTNTSGDGSVPGQNAILARARRKAGWNKIAVTSIIQNCNSSCTQGNTNKNSENPITRQSWPAYADVFLNTAATPAWGADNALQNTTYSTTGIHWDTPISEAMVGQMYSYAFRRLYGNTINGAPNVAVASPYLVQPEDIFFETNTAGAISAFLIPAQFFTGQTVTVKNIGAGALTVNPKPVVATITNLALTTNVVTITAANNWTAGDVLVLTGLSANPTLNGKTIIVSSTGLSASSFQAPLTNANITSAAETGVTTNADYAQIGAITNIAETAGNVVTATISNNFASGNSVKISGVTTATWLNGQTVSLTTANATSVTFTDGSAHGLAASTPDTGTIIFTYPAETINGGASATVASGATAVFLSQFTADATGGATWITLQNN